AELLGRPVRHLDDSVGPPVEQAISQMRDGDVVMLENVRFHPGETRNDPEFAKQLASLGDVFVNDSFGTAHRAHASTVGVAAYLRHPIHLPLDAVVAAGAKPGVATRVVNVRAIPADQRVLDIGPMTVERFLMIADGAGAVVWNGPLGVYEVPPFDQGTASLARGLAGTAAQTIVGGGDLVAALQELGLAGHMSFVSTGGGATLEFLEGKTLPGLAALR